MALMEVHVKHVRLFFENEVPQVRGRVAQMRAQRVLLPGQRSVVKAAQQRAPWLRAERFTVDNRTSESNESRQDDPLPRTFAGDHIARPHHPEGLQRRSLAHSLYKTHQVRTDLSAPTETRRHRGHRSRGLRTELESGAGRPWYRGEHLLARTRG